MRLPLLFVAGIVIAGVVSALIAIQLLTTFARNQTISELTREATGIAQLYQSAVTADFASPNSPSRAPTFAGHELETATGDQIYFDGPVSPFPGENPGIQVIQLTKVDWTSGRSLTFQFTPPGHTGTYDAVAHPVSVGHATIGAIIVAKKTTETNAVVLALLRRLLIAGVVGLVVAGALAFWFSRRLVRPLIALAGAADIVAGGNYDVAISSRAPGEIGRLTERFQEMAARLKTAETHERNFLMSVSHELRTPLTAIRGHVSALSEGLLESAEQRARSLETVEAEVNRLERLVGDILDLARLDTHRFTVLVEEVGMDRLVEQAYDTYSERARTHGIEFELVLSARPVIVSDGDRVLQIVGNLLSNAFRATPDGGKIRLELAQVNGTVSVSVEDTGPGIALADREQLFRPFFSGESHGTGLGLTIARELSHALGGEIELESEVGHGSRFELLLPA